jgi:hypothetical protein
MQTAKRFVSEPSTSEFEVAVGELAMYRSPGFESDSSTTDSS